MKSQVLAGQIWSYNGKKNYLVTKVSDDGYCNIQDMDTNDTIDRYSQSTLSEHGYNDGTWKLVKNIMTVAECPECNQEKEIPEGDFLCKECRRQVLINGRMIVELNEGVSIASFEGNAEEFSIKTDTEFVLKVRKDDIPIPVLLALKEFVK